jgi:hypothetical protein
MSTSSELRDLARAIEKLCNESPCVSLAGGIVNHCTNYLQLLAGFHEQIHTIESYRKKEGISLPNLL